MVGKNAKAMTLRDSQKPLEKQRAQQPILILQSLLCQCRTTQAKCTTAVSLQIPEKRADGAFSQ